jgi:hypothetical protein
MAAAAAIAAAGAAGAALLVAAGAIAGVGAQCSERPGTCNWTTVAIVVGWCVWSWEQRLSFGVSYGGDGLRILYISQPIVDHNMQSSEELCSSGHWYCGSARDVVPIRPPPVALCPQQCPRPGSGVGGRGGGGLQGLCWCALYMLAATFVYSVFIGQCVQCFIGQYYAKGFLYVVEYVAS